MHKKIGLYGGTFDPVHAGHTALVNSFLSTDLIDELWIILTPFPPHKLNTNPTTYTRRLDMLQLAFNSMNNVVIQTFENELPKPSYTYRTIEHLRLTYSDNHFYYCLGGDSLVNFHTWKHPDRIINEVDLLVAARPGFEGQSIDATILSKTYFVEHVPLDISSTDIKLRIAGNKSIEGLVDQDVESYIRTHKLYRSN
jgi:nicotinate-nucleotide adenylyltransferase